MPFPSPGLSLSPLLCVRLTHLAASHIPPVHCIQEKTLHQLGRNQVLQGPCLPSHLPHLSSPPPSPDHLCIGEGNRPLHQLREQQVLQTSAGRMHPLQVGQAWPQSLCVKTERQERRKCQLTSWEACMHTVPLDLVGGV